MKWALTGAIALLSVFGVIGWTAIHVAFVSGHPPIPQEAQIHQSAPSPPPLETPPVCGTAFDPVTGLLKMRVKNVSNERLTCGVVIIEKWINDDWHDLTPIGCGNEPKKAPKVLEPGEFATFTASASDSFWPRRFHLILHNGKGNVSQVFLGELHPE